MYLLDTNVISELRRLRPHGAVVAWLQGIADDDLHLSAVTLGELQAGVEITREQDPAKAAEIDRTEAYPYDNVAALKAAGFMGYTIPASHGGRGGSYFEAALIIEEMARQISPGDGLVLSYQV